MKHEIQTTNDLNGLTFDTSIGVPIFYSDEHNSTDKYKGIMNLNKNELVQVASDTYSIIQHNEVTSSVFDVLKDYNLDVSGRVDDFGNKIRADLVFNQDHMPVKDDASGVKIGIRVVNSYDKSTAFRLEMFGFRMICQNGMSLGSAMNDIKEITYHSGKDRALQDIRVVTKNFIRKVVESSSKLQEMINDSISDTVEFGVAMKTLEKFLKQKNHREKICKLLGISVIEAYDKETKKRTFAYVPETEESKVLSRWNLYNAVTDYATHNELSYGVEGTIQNAAQEILKNRFVQEVVVSTN